MEHMDIASPVGNSNQKCNDLCSSKKSRHQEFKSESVENESTEIRLADHDHVDTKKLIALADHDENVNRQPEKVDMKNCAKNSSRKSQRMGKKVSQIPTGRNYLLRSSLDGVRVLRSMSNKKSKVTADSVSSSVNSAIRRRKKWRKAKGSSNDEFSKIRKRVKYLLTRMNYEQSLLDAYSGEGWKGQSLEKIRPEKELERAKSEIIRCKLKIRDSFQHLDSLLSEGRFQESLFDSEGQIDSEDIFCAKCGSKDLSTDNDIILCDGNCDRGFHQKCLNPPLLNEDIPLGDEGWLCPACDCKVDCIDVLNEFHGSELSIEDSWEKVFPEAAAIANGDKQYDDSNFPSDDSEDDDFDPNAPEVDTDDQNEGSSSEESYFTTSSTDSEPSNHNMQYDVMGLPSEDSEDDDFDPEGLEPDEEIQKDGSSSDESDFTSDSDEFCTELSKKSGANEVSSSPLSDLKPLDSSGGGQVMDRNKSSTNSEHLNISEPDLSQEDALPVSGKRQLDVLDYKKLYDETYGKTSSDSSDDEDWNDKSALKKRKRDDNGKGCAVPAKAPKARDHSVEIHRISRSTESKLTKDDTTIRSDSDQMQASQVVNENTPRRRQKKSHSVAQAPDSNGDKATTPVRRQFDQLVTQKLNESFKVNQYPNRETKESLAEELKITVQQISKWFENARHSMRVSGNKPNHPTISTPVNGTNLSRASRSKTQSDKGTVQNSSSNGSKRKNSGKTEKNKVHSVHRISGGDKAKKAQDDKRQKAIERELRKGRRNK